MRGRPQPPAQHQVTRQGAGLWQPLPQGLPQEPEVGHAAADTVESSNVHSLQVLLGPSREHWASLPQGTVGTHSLESFALREAHCAPHLVSEPHQSLLPRHPELLWASPLLAQHPHP